MQRTMGSSKSCGFKVWQVPSVICCYLTWQLPSVNCCYFPWQVPSVICCYFPWQVPSVICWFIPWQVPSVICWLIPWQVPSVICWFRPWQVPSVICWFIPWQVPSIICWFIPWQVPSVIWRRWRTLCGPGRQQSQTPLYRARAKRRGEPETRPTVTLRERLDCYFALLYRNRMCTFHVSHFFEMQRQLQGHATELLRTRVSGGNHTSTNASLTTYQI